MFEIMNECERINLDIIKEWLNGLDCSYLIVKHDKDLPRKAHYHIFVKLANERTFKDIAKSCDTQTQYIERVKGWKNALAYATRWAIRGTTSFSMSVILREDRQQWGWYSLQPWNITTSTSPTPSPAREVTTYRRPTANLSKPPSPECPAPTPCPPPCRDANAGSSGSDRCIAPRRAVRCGSRPVSCAAPRSRPGPTGR